VKNGVSFFSRERKREKKTRKKRGRSFLASLRKERGRKEEEKDLICPAH